MLSRQVRITVFNRSKVSHSLPPLSLLKQVMSFSLSLLWLGSQVASNVHTIRTVCSPGDERKWVFAPKVSWELTSVPFPPHPEDILNLSSLCFSLPFSLRLSSLSFSLSPSSLPSLPSLLSHRQCSIVSTTERVSSDLSKETQTLVCLLAFCVCLFVSLSVCPSVHLSVCLSVQLSICPSIHSSVHSSVCLSASLSLLTYATS